MHTYVQTTTHTVHTYIHTYIRTYIQTYIHTHIHTETERHAYIYKFIHTFNVVTLDTRTNFPAVSWNSLLAVAMMNIRHRWNGIAVPTQSHPNAASLILLAWNISHLMFEELLSLHSYFLPWQLLGKQWILPCVFHVKYFSHGWNFVR